MIEVARLPVQRDPQTVCAVECGARCCRSPKAQPIVRGAEMRRLKQIAAERGIKLRFLNATALRTIGDQLVKLTDRWQLLHEDGACPFLLREQNLCGIYADRPGVCRDFPVRPVQGCLLAPGSDGDPEL